MKKLGFLLALICIAITACETGTGTNTAEPTVKKGIKPVADDEIAVIEMEDASAYGTITIELYSNIAPKMVARFKELAKEGVYNGVTFHRVSADVIQSGDPNSKDDDPTNDGKGSSDKPNVEAEFSDIEFDAGIVGAARGPDFNSANSQFFIMKKRQPNFNNRYTVFGKVIDGMNNVTTIGGAPVQGEKPMSKIVIKKITIRPKS
ncbi:MAG: peptidylprolyl isomerase [Pyrinomonadaceae bacterium]|nr:peptidylprolyl isomerase [Pyrinomonadaceae bacterium]